MNLRCLVLVSCFWILMTTMASHLSAQDEMVGSAKVAKLEAIRVSQVAESSELTVPKGYLNLMRAPEGMAFLICWMELEVETAEDEFGDEIVNISADKVVLADRNGFTYPNFGQCSRDGRFSEYGGSIYVFDRLEQQHLSYNAVFVVPANLTQFELKINQHKHAFRVEGPVAETLDPTKIADFKITSKTVVDKLERDYPLGTFDRPIGEAIVAVQSRASRFLVTKVVISPNAINGDGLFSVRAADFGLQVHEDIYIPAIGILEHGEFSVDSWGQATALDLNGRLPAITVELVFPIPRSATDYQLLYLTRPIASDRFPANP